MVFSFLAQAESDPATKKEKPGGKMEIVSGNSGTLLGSGESGLLYACPGGGCTQKPEDGATGLDVKCEFVGR